DLVQLSKNNINKNRGNRDTKTCIELDSNNDNITLQWDDLYVFTWLRIALTQEISELITDLLILFRQDINKTVSYVPCQNKLFYVIKPQTIDVRCDFNGTFKELVLKGRTIQWICTLNINGGRNVALKQSTTQSGAYTDRSHTEEYSNSSNAVDGKALYSFKEKSCAHPYSSNRKQFWSVKFPPRVVTGYVLYDRQDGAENFNGFKLTASTGNEIQFEYIDEQLKVPKRIYTIPHPHKSPVSNVTIYRDGTLNVCEVEVYGECPPGTWGLNCSQCTARCPHNCQVDDGSCEILCPGFSNPPFCNQTCDSGWFGDGCKYKCHCEGNCDTSGYCTNNKCSDGWFGYKCQYRDLMYLVSLEANRVIFDNNDDTCITSKPDSIILRWNEAYVFTWLRIVVKNETFITDLKIQFQKNEKQSTQFLACQNQRLYLVDSKTMDIWCDLNDTFHQLTITGKAILSLCTLNVNGGRNVALKQNTAQSGTYSSARSKEDAAQSSNAVDGKLDAKHFTFKEKSCAHTAVGDKNPFWSVQFLPHLITEYVLYDRR
ncbi:multiple epidermal growth factor-like domains protein 11, partial [Biomphalaria glabrata]